MDNMAIKLTVSDPLPKDGRRLVVAEYFDSGEAPEAMRQLLEEAEKLYGKGRPIFICGRTRNDAGFLEPGYFIAAPYETI